MISRMLSSAACSTAMEALKVLDDVCVDTDVDPEARNVRKGCTCSMLLALQQLFLVVGVAAAVSC